MHFLLADEESKSIIFAICSSCFISFCLQNQIFGNRAPGHVAACKDVQH